MNMTTDHPRSRGVYVYARDEETILAGSSPLARGLPVRGQDDVALGRIIPARAGFTSEERESPRRCAGSSPLARGLPGLAGGDRAPVGIIPARAGFTGRVASRRRRARDHPRSRGVYHQRRSRWRVRGGSSPLARGLRARGPARPRPRRHRRRIIPARAGFTGWPPQRRSSSEDHPRSRGVYYSWCGYPFYAAGSSPLARGLRTCPCTGSWPRRIIPARAGFTIEWLSPITKTKDHPRSRGVYARPPAIPFLPGGSSPLARGLPRLLSPTVGRMRIIPARAGFTNR